MTTGYADLPGTRVYYEDVGTGHPVILIHGFTLDARMWDRQMDALSQNYRVIRYDVRGFGRSGPPGSEPYSEVEDLKHFLDFLGISSCSLVGLSMGGAIAQAFALVYPEYVASQVLVDSGLPGANFGQFGRDLQRISTLASESGVDAAREQWLAHPLFAPANEIPEVSAELRQIVGDYRGWHWLEDVRTGVDTIDRLHEINAPTQVIVGDRDLPRVVELAKKLADEIPDSSLHVMEGAGHMSNMEAPAEFNELVLSFLAEQHPEV